TQITEVGSAHCHRIRRRSKAGNLQAELRRLARVATGRATVAARKKHRHALRGGLLPKLVEKLIARSSKGGLADSVALTDNWRDIVIDDILRREVNSESRVGRRVNHKLNRRIGSDCA